MLRLCVAEGIGVLPWSPLARGRLTHAWESKPGSERAQTDDYGRTLYAPSEEADQSVISRLCEISSARGIPPAQAALAWLLHHSPVTVPIPGTSSVEHLEENVAAAAIRLSDDDIAALDELAAKD